MPAEIQVRMREDACAKVNLYLHIVGRRRDGYHLIDSLFIFLAVGDELHITDAPALSLEIDGPFAHQLGGGAENLVMTAARRLAEAGKITLGAALRLTKTLPVAAGLGGGSSDAAAALRGLRAHWDLAFTDSDLMDIALQLGADVPSCIAQSPALVGGVGELVTPMTGLPEFWVILVNPGVEVSTAEVFAAYKNTGCAFSMPAPLGVTSGGLGSFIDELSGRRNDLEIAACNLAPAIDQVLSELRSFDESLIVRMSGSGGTCYALYETKDVADSIAAQVAERHPDWWVVSAPPRSSGA